MSVEELGQPGVANPGTLGYSRPIAAPLVQQIVDLGVQGFHAPILVKISSKCKEHFTSPDEHALPVQSKTIVAVVAENLGELVGSAKLSQTTLAKKAGVSQKTVSNFLNPAQRAVGAKGKAPSGKLTELEMICNVLQVPVWQVCREMTPKEREMYRRIELAYRDLIATAN